MNASLNRRLPIVPLAISFIVGAGVTATLFLVLAPLLDNEQIEPLPSPTAAPVPDTEQDEADETPPTESATATTLESLDTPATLSEGELDTLFRFDSDYERTSSLYALLEQTDANHLHVLLEESQDIDLLFRSAVQRALIHRLAIIDPKSALDQVRILEDSDSEELVKSVFGHWARVDLDEAVEHSKSLDMQERWSALRGIFLSRRDLSEDDRIKLGQELGETQFVKVWNDLMQEEEYARNPEQSWYEIVEEAQHDNMQFNLLHSVAEAWLKKDGVEVVDKIIESMSNQQTRMTIVTLVLRSAAKSDPKNALDRALNLEIDPRNNIATSVVYEWSTSDPRAALAYISALEPGRTRERLLGGVMWSWAQSGDPYEMLEELSGMSEELQVLGNQAALTLIASSSPEKAAELIGNLKDGNEKKNIASTIARNWSQKDPTEALNWVMNNPDIATYRQDLLDSVLSNLAAQDPKLAMRAALAQPADSDSIGLEATVISSLARQDVNKALEFLPDVRDGKSKMYAYGSVGMALANNGDTDQALELAENIVESERDTYFHLLSLAWANTDPEQLFETLGKFPSDASKSKAAAILTMMHGVSPSLSDKQAEELKKYLSEKDKREIEEGGMGLLNLGPYMDLLGFGF